MITSEFLILIGVITETCIWFAFFKTRISRRRLSKISIMSGLTVLFGLIGYLAELY